MPFDVIFTVIWVALWGIGGYWLVTGLFALQRHENFMVGFGVGLVVQTWLVNVFGHFLPVMWAFWLAPIAVLLFGALAERPWLHPVKSLFPHVPIGQVLTFGVVCLGFLMVGRGLAIFDDYQNIPITSQLAMGDIPPRFSLAPDVSFGYHYFLLLLSGQYVRIMQVTPWYAIDLVRGVVFGLGVVMVWMLTLRLTKSKIAAVLGAVFWSFAGGVRWLLLLIPAPLLERWSAGVQLIGSGRETADTLATALIQPWNIEGFGPLPYPFAFLSGVAYPPIIRHGGFGALGMLMVLLVLLTANHWRDWRSVLVTTVILASFGLAFEALVVFSVIAWGMMAALMLWRKGLRGVPNTFWQWFGASFVAGLIILVQGGVFTPLFFGLFTTGDSAGYFTLSFPFTWPPVLISAHLGVLNLANPFQLLVALFEIGPVVLVLPLFAVFGWRAFQKERWFEANLVLAAFLSLGMLFFQYQGTAGISATTRLYIFVWIASIYAVALAWEWLRDRGEGMQLATLGVFVLPVISGFVIFGAQLPAAQRPVPSYFIDTLDTIAYERYWNELPEGAMVFDASPPRPASIFGRLTNSSTTWYSIRPDWQALADAPYAADVRAAGYDYMYLDQIYFRKLPGDVRDDLLTNDCIILVDEITSEQIDGYRRLLDIRGCE